MDKLKLTKILLNLLCSDESESLDAILPAVLKLANKMLKYAIEEIQTQFYKEFESNRKSEKLFERICTAINRNIFIHRWHPQMFAMQRVEKVSQKIGNIDIQKEILKFVRSLCLNQHENLQKFMAEQKLNKTSYNMIDLLVTYLETLVKEISNINEKKSGEIIGRELETLEGRKKLSYSHAILTIRALFEFIQGPCHSNQNAIGNTNLIQIANAILSLKLHFENDKNAEVKCLFSNYELCKLKLAIANLLISLLEQRGKDDFIVTLMRQSIKERELLENMLYVYYMFHLEKEAYYTDELLFTVSLSSRLCYSHMRSMIQLFMIVSLYTLGFHFSLFLRNGMKLILMLIV